MLEKTRGIVLNTIRYSDSGIIVHLYTRMYGRISVLIRGLRKKKSTKHNIMFQPMFILELEIYYKPSREMQLVKEYSFLQPFYNIHTDIRKSTVALFLGEVLSSVIGEESANPGLYSYIEDSVLWFEQTTAETSNFHISFLTGLTRYLGIEPSARKGCTEKYLDLRNGQFVSSPPMHGEYAPENISLLIAEFLNFPIEHASAITLTGKLRNEVLETLIRYYSYHLPALRKINSLAVLKEVFG